MRKASAGDIHQFVGAVNRHDLEGLLELFREDAIVSGGPRFPQPIVGKDAIRGLFRSYFDALDEMLLAPYETFTDGNEGVSFMTITATLRQRLPGEEPPAVAAGLRRVSWRGAYRFVLDENGKIRQLSIYGDESTARWLPGVSGPVRPG